jgi:hypothetical protein
VSDLLYLGFLSWNGVWDSRVVQSHTAGMTKEYQSLSARSTLGSVYADPVLIGMSCPPAIFCGSFLRSARACLTQALVQRRRLF